MSTRTDEKSGTSFFSCSTHLEIDRSLGIDYIIIVVMMVVKVNLGGGFYANLYLNEMQYDAGLSELCLL